MKSAVLCLAAALLSGSALADTPAQILKQLESAAGSGSASRGESFYNAKKGGGEAESCASCHTKDPRQAGQHAKTHKHIDPLSPSANKERFTDMKHVQKWFKRNCKEVLGRECSDQEKADFAAYVISK